MGELYLMDFEECVKKRIIKKVSKDEGLIKSLLNTSKNKLDSEKKLILDNVTSVSKISLLYDSIRELLEALSLSKGFKIYNHECYVPLLKEILNKEIIAEEFNDLRKIRNRINYYGLEISIKEAKEILERLNKLRKDIINLI